MLPLIVSPLATTVAFLATAAVVIGGAYLKGREHGREALLADQLTAAQAIAGRQQKVTERVVVEYRDRVQTIKEKGGEIVREVEKLVPVGGCELDGGWRVLHDAAARGRLPDAAGGAHGPPAPVDPIAAARTVAGNYATCHEIAAQLTGLQEWVQKQHETTNKGD